MKLGVVGKGGVGKTTVAALLAHAYTRRQARVVAIDTDSNPNLGLSLGLDLDATEAVPVLPRSLIVGVGGDMSVTELMRDYGRPTPAGVTLLSAIRVTVAGSGCTCAGHSTVRSLLEQALTDTADVAVVDMEAGLEHLSRSGGTLAHADTLLVVTEPSRKSVVTAARTASLADELGIPRTCVLGNKARTDTDEAFLRDAAEQHGLSLVGMLPYTDEVRAADLAGSGVFAEQPAAVRDEIDRVIGVLETSTLPVA